MLWLLVSGFWSHQLGAGSRRVEASEWPSGHTAGEAPMGAEDQTQDLSHLTCQPQGLRPTPARLPRGALSRPSPATCPHSRGSTSLGHEPLSPLLSLPPTRAGKTSIFCRWGHSQRSRPGVSEDTPPPQQLTRPA